MSKKRDKNNSPEEPQGSKKNPQKKKNKGEMSKCAYCSKGNHSKKLLHEEANRHSDPTPGEEWNLPS